MNSNLTNRQHWENIATNKRVGKVNLEHISRKKIHETFQNTLPVDENFLFLEPGCHPGQWMIYFNEFYKYKIHGVEYSEKLSIATRKNLKHYNIDGEIINCDIFDYNPKTKYDVIFSAGLIEHFTNYNDLIEHMKNLLSEKGYLITIIPNLGNFTFHNLVSRIFIPEIFKKHIPIKLKQLLQVHTDLNLEIIYASRIGVYNNLLPKIERFEFLHKVVQKISKSFLLPHIQKRELETAFFSPYQLIVSRNR